MTQVMMQGRNAVIQPAISRIPRADDLQKLLRAVQTGPAPVQQPINMDSGRKFVLKVQQARGTTGLGRPKVNTNEPPLWSLCEGLATVWEYNTTDLELIFNLIEEAVYTAAPANTPLGGTANQALQVLGELAALQPDLFGAAAQPDYASTPSANSNNYGGGLGSTIGGNHGGNHNSGNHNSGQSTGFNAQQAAAEQAISQTLVGGQQNPAYNANPYSSNVGYQSTSSQFSAPLDQIQAAYTGSNSGNFSNPRTSGQFASASASQFMTPQEVRKANPRSSQTGMQLSGNLSELGVCDLFQSISVAKMTGRLDITSGLESIEVFFEEGAPRRASFQSDSMTGPVRELVGEEVLLEGMTWETGFFQFNSAMKSAERSPMRRLDLLLLEGSTLRDYCDYLAKAGMDNESVASRIGTFTESDFEKAINASVPVNMNQQKAFYIAFDGKTALGDIVRNSNLGKAVWLPLVFNLLKCGMIGLPAKVEAPTAAGETQSPMIKEAVQEAFQELLRPDTALLSYPLFLHFAEVEFQRALKLRLPLSLAIIKVHKEGSGMIEQLSSEDLKLLADRLRLSLEPYDHIGHYQTLDIGILMPHRHSAQAREHLSKFIADFDQELASTGNQVRFVWSIGVGCIPEDGIKLSAMISKAEQEKNAVASTQF